MSFRDLIDCSKAIALSEKLHPDEAAAWKKYCRSYSRQFSEPLSQVLLMDPLTVMTAVFSDQLEDWDIEENLENVMDLLNGLQDPDYDIKKERVFREEMRNLEEQERL